MQWDKWQEITVQEFIRLAEWTEEDAHRVVSTMRNYYDEGWSPIDAVLEEAFIWEFGPTR